MGALASQSSFKRFALVAAVPMLASVAGEEEFMTLDCEFRTTHVIRLENGKTEELPSSGDGLTITFTGFDPVPSQ
jgi:hypothetical protein